MTSLDALLIALWALSIVASLAIIWTPWRLTRGNVSIDLSDQITGRPISPLHAFALPAVLLAAPLVLVAAGVRTASGWARPQVAYPLVLLLLAGAPAIQLLLRREVLKALTQRQAEHARVQAVLASGGAKSVRRS